jgi:hypothetical protein
MYGKKELGLKKKNDFDWFTTIIFLKPNKFLAVKTFRLTSAGEVFGEDPNWKVFAEEYGMQLIKRLLHTKVYVSDYGLSNMLMRYPKEITGRIREYDKLTEIF